MTFPAQSPDLRRFPLVAGASRSVVRSPRSAAPRIRFLFVDSRVRFTLRSAYASRRTPCASLRSLRPGSGRTFTSKSSPMPGPPRKKSPPGQDLEGQERSRWGRVEKGATDPKWPLSSIYSGRTMSRCTSKGAEIMRSLRIREVFGVKLGMHQCILRRSANTPSTNTPFGGRQK